MSRESSASSYNPPLIAVAIPTYNGERYIADTIDSVLSQSYTHIELVVVDDGSTDRTAAVVDAIALRDDRLRKVTQKNGGIAVARNVCLAEVSPHANYVLLLDHDDLLV